MLERRVQILLDDERYRKVADEAKRRGTSIGAIVREAIDRLPTDLEQRRALLAKILAAEPMPVPDDPADLRRELEDAHDALEQ
jgi:ferritin-like protein